MSGPRHEFAAAADRETLRLMIETESDLHAGTDNQADGYKGDDDLGLSPDDQADGFKGSAEDFSPPAPQDVPEDPPFSIATRWPVTAMKVFPVKK